MSIAVVMTANMQCPMGNAPSTLMVTSQVKVMAGGKLAATIQDGMPLSNIMPFGMCMSLANPMVAAATAAALGVLTPQPCIPNTTGMWICPKSPMVGGKPGLGNDGKLMCVYGGVITITNPGQTKVMY